MSRPKQAARSPHEIKAAILEALLDQGHGIQGAGKRGMIRLDGVLLDWTRAAAIAGLDAATGAPAPSPEPDIERDRRWA